jgi:hypothetical protein
MTYRPISICGLANTTRRDHIKAAGALANADATFFDAMPMTKDKMIAA